MNNVLINISNDFTKTPGARYRTDGDFSGQEFYEDIFKPKFQSIWDEQGKKLEINLDGTLGYASSFISQIFISVVQDFKDVTKIKKKLILKSDEDPLLLEAIDRIIKRAAKGDER